jgi:hypothetical protein
MDHAIGLREMAMPDDVFRLTKVSPGGNNLLRVRFAGDRRDRTLDLTDLFARSVHFAPLKDDAAAFEKATMLEGGLGVSWPVQSKWGPLDVSAATLHRIAQQQEPRTGADSA